MYKKLKTDPVKIKKPNYYYNEEFALMYDLIISVIQPLGNAHVHVALHLMPFLSPEYSFWHDWFKGPRIEGRVSLMLRKRLLNIPGYEGNKEMAVKAYAGVVPHSGCGPFMKYESETDDEDDGSYATTYSRKQTIRLIVLGIQYPKQ